MENKRCDRCDLIKPVSEFGLRINGSLISKECKNCVNTRRNNWCKGRKGLLFTMYRGQVNSSVKRGHNHPEYSLEEFRHWAINLTNFNDIYELWVSSGYNKWLRPSCDRIKDELGYSINNIRMVTWKVNFDKYHDDIKSGVNKKMWIPVVRLNINNTYSGEYPSIRKASEDLGCDESAIVKCCRNKKKTHYGFKWKYKSDYDKLNN